MYSVMESWRQIVIPYTKYILIIYYYYTNLIDIIYYANVKHWVVERAKSAAHTI